MSALDRTVATLGALSLAELLELRALLDELIAAERESDLQASGLAHSSTGSPAGSGGGAGYVELKLINGYGPYKYLRRAVYSGQGKRKLESKYLGKAKAD